MSEHLRPEDLAGRFGITRAQVMSFCASKAWPHERFGRRVRFTPEQVAQIEALHSVAPKAQPVNAWGRKTRKAS